MRKWIIICLGLVVAGGAALYLSGTLPLGNKSQEVSVEFPDKLNERIFVYQGDHDQRLRNMVYAEDGKTPLYAETDYANGDTGKVIFRPDFTAQSILRFFNPTLVNGERVVRSSFVIGTDGRTVIELSEFDLNKKLVLKGMRQPDGQYTERRYDADGLVTRYRLLNKTAMIFGGTAFSDYMVNAESLFYPGTSSLQSHFVRTESYITEKTTYLLSGAIETFLRTQGTIESGYALWPNGKTRVSFEKRSVSSSSWSVEYGVYSKSYDQSGQLIDTRMFRTSVMSVTLNLPEFGEVTQNWRPINSGTTGDALMKQENYALYEVLLPVLGPYNKVTVILGKDGKPTDLYHQYMEGDAEIKAFISLRPDGSFAKIRTYNTSTFKSGETVFIGNEGGSFQMPAELREATHFEIPLVRPNSPTYSYHP
ncbi:MAG: hypothetical protein IPG59_12425 [Candidatus Melainabacteria bacterium]|nr:MAG: hypothetical protein IPG59_12425 [Candidatus Melainabacteria bacterium]